MKIYIVADPVDVREVHTCEEQDKGQKFNQDQGHKPYKHIFLGFLDENGASLNEIFNIAIDENHEYIV